MGDVEKVEVDKAAAKDPKPGNPNVKLGEELPNCGVTDGCNTESFPVHLYTGKGNSEGPQICVSGK